MEGKYLITTDNWFTAPDGNDYKSVWGSIEILNDSVLGVKTNARSTNWFAKVGSEENHLIIAGCQIHYAVKSDEKPKLRASKHWGVHQGQVVISQKPNQIYIAE